MNDSLRVSLQDAHHLICYGVPLPGREEVRNRCVRLHAAQSLADLADYCDCYVTYGQRIALVIPDDGSRDDAIRVVDDRYEAAAIAERSAVATAERIGWQLIYNIHHYAKLPFITDYDRPLAGRPAFVVYSGPSLDRNISLLPECQTRGAVISTPTPVQAVVTTGIEPDVLINLECRKTFDSMRDARPLIYVGDMILHADNWDVTASHKMRMFQPDLAYLQYCTQLGTIPIGNGGFVGGCAVNLAYLWGANPIVLIGFDLALTDGRTCTSLIGSDTTLEYSDQFVIFRSSHPCHGKSYWTEVPAYGGAGTVRTTYERVGYREYLEQIARLATGVELINATEGGSHVVGWSEESLRGVLNRLPKAPEQRPHSNALGRPLNPEMEAERVAVAATILRRIRRACEVIVFLGDKKISADNELKIRALVRAEPILYTQLMPHIVRLKHARPNTHERIRRVREITIKCAAKLIDVIDRES